MWTSRGRPTLKCGSMSSISFSRVVQYSRHQRSPEPSIVPGPLISRPLMPSALISAAGHAGGDPRVIVGVLGPFENRALVQVKVHALFEENGTGDKRALGNNDHPA